MNPFSFWLALLLQWFWNLVSVWAEIDENCNGDGSLLHATTPEWHPNCNSNSEEKWPRRCRGCKGQKSSRIFSHIYADDPRYQMISCAGDDVLTNRNTQQGLMTWGVPKANSIIIPAQTWIERLSHLIVADFRSLCWWNILHTDQLDGVHDPSHRIHSLEKKLATGVIKPPSFSTVSIKDRSGYQNGWISGNF